MRTGAQAELTDIGANLTNRAFAADTPEVLARAHEAGVTRLLITGTSVELSAHARRITGDRRLAGPVKLFSTAGVHPHHAGTHGDLAMRSLGELLVHEEVVAVGECGLDFNRNYSEKKDQLACFEAQLALAASVKKPVFLHERDATDTFADILARHRPSLTGGVVHCFTGDARALARYLEMDLYIGITGWICDERRGRHLLDLVQMIPRERILVETDAPYLFPRDLDRSRRRNEPCFVRHVAATVAKARGETPDDLAAISTENARRLFALP